tara:strand:+ start:155 stop:601 length:447 start_codon:yes stop_codon:yes gene_type:complete
MARKLTISTNREQLENALEELSEDIGLLMGRFDHGHLTRNQAEATLELLPDVEKAMIFAGTYLSLPKSEREELYGVTYEDFLETLRTGLYGSEDVITIHDVELAERTISVPQEALTQVGPHEPGKDNPYRGGHYHEHLAAQAENASNP